MSEISTYKLTVILSNMTKPSLVISINHSTQFSVVHNILTTHRLIYFNFWFTDFIEHSADRIPNEDKYCLPTCLTKREVYLTYVDDLKTAGKHPVSWATFSRMWKKQFRNVIIPKVQIKVDGSPKRVDIRLHILPPTLISTFLLNRKTSLQNVVSVWP